MANRIQAGAFFVVCAVKIGKLQQRSNSLKMGMRQLAVINKKLRAAMSKCEHRKLKEYPNLEIMNIDEFIGNLMELTETLVVNVNRAVKSFCKINKVKEGNSLWPELEALAGQQEAHGKRRSPETCGKNETRSNRLPPPSSRAQELERADSSASGGLRNYKAYLQEATSGMRTISAG